MSKESSLSNSRSRTEINEQAGDFVSWDSPVYQEYMSSRQRIVLEHKKRPFGDFVITFNALDEHSINHPLTDSLLHDCTSTLDRIAEEGGDFGMSEARMLFAEGLMDPDVRNDPNIQALTRGMVGDARAPAKLFDAYINRTLDRRALLKILRAHSLNFIVRAGSLEKQLPKIEQEFLADLHALIADPNHPLTSEMLSEETISKRVAAVKVYMGDPLAMAMYNTTIGDFSPDTEIIGVVYESPINMSKGKDVHFEKTYRHEMVHALSGRAITIENKYHLPHKRLGIMEIGTDFNRWLNEPITEQLTQDMRGKRHNYLDGSYTDEREIYRLLLQRVPEELFLRAYFENTETGPVNKAPHNEALLVAIEREFGAGFIENLNKSVGNEGVEEALRMFDTFSS